MRQVELSIGRLGIEKEVAEKVEDELEKKVEKEVEK